AYWLARVRLLSGQPQAITAFEQLLRSLQGSPQAICWFVDLLWRAGLRERAEQVWKPLRANRRVAACDEAFLQEARLLLREGDLAAVRVLDEARPRSGVTQVERYYLLAWIAVGRRQFEDAGKNFAASFAGFYPEVARHAWLAFAREKGVTGVP